MYSNSKKLLSLILTIALVLSIIVIPTTAIDSTGTEFTSATVEIDGSEDKTVTLNWKVKENVQLQSIEGNMAPSTASGKITLTTINHPNLSFVGEDYANSNTGNFACSKPSGVNLVDGDVILSGVYTVDKSTPAGTYNVVLHVELFEDDVYGFDDYDYTATITVTEPAVGPDYEIYYKLDKENNSTNDIDDDNYIEYDPNNEVVVSVYVKAKEATKLQAFDLYITNDAALINPVVSDIYDGIRIESGSAGQISTATLQHIQAWGHSKDNNPINLNLPANGEVKIAQITFTLNDTAAYGDQLPITIEDNTNIAIQNQPDSINPQSVTYPLTISAPVLGVETLKQYTITYDDNEGNDSAITFTVPTDGTKNHNEAYNIVFKFGSPANYPQRPGYTFLGWDTDKTSTNPTYTETGTTQLAAGVNADTTLYAIWSRNVYDVWWHYDADDTTQIHSQNSTYHYGETATYPSGAPTPVKADTTEKTFTFIGWNTDPTANAALATLTVDGKMDFYAIFSESARPYTVKWANTDGNGAETEVTIGYGSTPAYSGTPAKAEDATYTYTWTGWNDGTTQYGTTDVLPAVSGNVTYTATFDAVYKDYTISYDKGAHAADSYTAPAAKTDAHIGVAYNLPVAATPADGYTFTGWSDGTNTYPAGSSYTPTGTATLTAQYEEKTYTIVYDGHTADGGTAPASHTNQSFTADFTVANNTFTKTGYTFNSWNTKADGSGTVVINEGTTKKISQLDLDSSALADTTITLYAQWTRESDYTISYELHGGTVDTPNPTSYNVETATITLNNPSKVGYTFKGWSGTDLTGDTNTTVIIAQGSTGNRSYEAHWTPAEVNYKVEHYQQNLDNNEFTLAETEGPGGTYVAFTESTVTGTPKTYTGFTYDSTVAGTIASDTVAADGSTTLKLYYTRNTYTVTYEYTGSVPSGVTAPTDASSPYKYGATVYVKQNPDAVAGYTFSGWKIGGADAGTSFVIENNTTISGEWSLITYHVYFHEEGSTATGDNELVSGGDVTFNAETASITAPAVPAKAANADWYETGTWGAYNLATLANQDVYVSYTKKTFTVTFLPETGDTPIADQGTDPNYDFDDRTIDTPDVPEKPGYNGSWPTDITDTAGNKNVRPVYTPKEYTITFATDGGTAIPAMTYTIESPDTLPSATGKTNFSFVNWKVTTADGNWAANSTYNGGTAVTGKYGNVTLTAQWSQNLSYEVQEYKYAPTGYKLLIVDAANVGDGNVYKYGTQTMYYTTDANYQIGTSTAVFYTLVEVDNLALTDAQFSLIAASAGTAATITYDGDINGDDTVNIADANAIFQMVVSTGSYYSIDQLSIAQRLGADLVKATDNAEHRGSIEDVNAVVAIINGTN